MKNEEKGIETDFFRDICEIAGHLKEITEEAVELITPEVEMIINNKITDKGRIEKLLDSLLDYAGLTDSGLKLFKRLCKYYYKINPRVVIDYIYIYKDLYEDHNYVSDMEDSDLKYRQRFDDDFRKLFTKKLRENDEFGKELWSALANVSWYHKDDPENTEIGYSFRTAGSLIASILCYGDYMDWYCSGPDGVVSENIAKLMAKRGWHFKVLI